MAAAALGPDACPPQPCAEASDPHSPASPEFWCLASLSLLLLCAAGLFSGLTVGLMGIDSTALRCKLRDPDRTQRERARKILHVTADRHWLLITLLLANTAANEALPLVLDRIFPEVVAVVVSIAGVLVFGEVLPMSLLTGPRQFELVARFSGLVRLLMALLICVAMPVARLLDRLVGTTHATGISRGELRALLVGAACHCADSGARARSGEGGGEGASASLGREESLLAASALGFASKTAGSCMRGLNEVFMLEASASFDASLLRQIREEGYSRVPVFSRRRDCIVGVLLAKALVGVQPLPQLTLQQWACEDHWRDGGSLATGSQEDDSDEYLDGDRLGAARPEGQQLARWSPWRSPPVVPPGLPLPQLLHELRSNAGGCHLACVVEGALQAPAKDVVANGKLLGIVTLRDTLEELLQGEIQDEFDRARRRAKRAAAADEAAAVPAWAVEARPGRHARGSYGRLSDDEASTRDEAAPARSPARVIGRPRGSEAAV